MDTGDESTALHQYSIKNFLKTKRDAVLYVTKLLPDIDGCMSITITNLGKSEGFSVTTVIYASSEDIERGISYGRLQTT